VESSKSAMGGSVSGKWKTKREGSKGGRGKKRGSYGDEMGIGRMAGFERRVGRVMKGVKGEWGENKKDSGGGYEGKRRGND